MNRLQLIKQAVKTVQAENNLKKLLTDRELKTILDSDYTTTKNVDSVKQLDFN